MAYRAFDATSWLASVASEADRFLAIQADWVPFKYGFKGFLDLAEPRGFGVVVVAASPNHGDFASG
jgi:hypothetical protein